MTAHYSIDVDVTRSLLRITMGGFFGVRDIDGFVARRHAAHAQLTCARNQHVTITDVRAMKIQSQDMVATFRHLLADPAYRSRKLAFVTAPTLARPQLLRAVGSRGARTFDSYEAAEAWMFAADDRAAAA